jgi:glycyl-tRNA synthetase
MTPDADADLPALSELARRRGFFFQAGEAYGGVGGFYTFGPEGAALKRNLESAWRERFAVGEGHQEIDAPTIMPEAVFEASGHLDGFDDMLVACPECGERNRADHLVEEAGDVEDAEALGPERVSDLLAEYGVECPVCGTALAEQPVEDFNLMFGTNIGPGSSAPGYLRPETAQGIFVEFPRLSEYARGQLPFGVTQIGRAYRNEISPRRSLVRVREFTQSELELFVAPDDGGPQDAGHADWDAVADRELTLYPASRQGEDADGSDGSASADTLTTTVQAAVEEGVVADSWIAYYLGIADRWFEEVGVDPERFRFRQHRAGERAHYASDCWDAESRVRTGTGGTDWIELAGFAHRGCYDLSKHAEHAEESFDVFREYDEPRTLERATVDPDMAALGPEFGSQATAVADALVDLAETDPEAFEAEAVSVTVDGEDVSVPVDQTGFTVEEVTEHGEHVTPEVIEPSFGVDRLVYTVLDHALGADVVDDESRTYLSLPPGVAPSLVAVLPLMDREGMGERARDLRDRCQAAGIDTEYDDTGSIGRRYRRQDEVGTPYCVTVDHQTLEDDTVTIRDRDTTEQARVATDQLLETLRDLRAGDLRVDDL